MRTCPASLWMLLVCVSGAALAAEPTEPPAKPASIAIGDTFPEFETIDDAGNVWKSTDHVGQKVLVLYFYPGDFTGGCTRQAEAHREGLAKLEQADVELIGISADEAKTHGLFKKTYGLKHALLEDIDGKLARSLGLPVGRGATFRPQTAERKPILDEEGQPLEVTRSATVGRWTFIVGKDGKVIYKNTRVQPATDSQQVLEFIETQARETPAIEALKSHGAKVEYRDGIPGSAAVGIDFIACHVKGADLELLAALPHLERISLEGAGITSANLLPLVRLSKLRELNLANTKVDDEGMAFLGELKGLKKLNLAETRVTGRGIPRLATLVELESLNLNFTWDELSDADIAPLRALTRLKYLDLGGSHLSDDGLKALGPLVQLAELAIETTAVTDAGLEWLREIRPSLKVIH